MANNYFNDKTKLQPVAVVRLEAQEGKKQELISLIEGLVVETRKEDGSICYNVYQNIENPNKIIIYEIWESEEALNIHMKTEHFMNFLEKHTNLINGSLTLDLFERSQAPAPKSSENGLALFAINKALDGKSAQLQTILENLIAPTLAEKGAEHYELHKLKCDESVFLFHETWTTIADWDAHMLTQHLIDYLAIMADYADGSINVEKTKQIF